MSNEKIFAEDMQLTHHTLPIIEQITEQMPGGFFIYRADDTEELLFENDALLEIFGCKSKTEFEALTGNSFKGMVHPDDLAEVQASISSQVAASRKKTDYAEYRIVRRDGSVRYVDNYGHFVHTEDYGDLYYVFINDATDKHLARELEKERHINKAKMTFLFNISHDIRTPMNSIMGFTSLALENLNEPELLADYLGKVSTSNRHMISLIDDILEMSSIESGQVIIRSEACSLSESLQEVVDMVRPQAEEKDITIEQDIKLPDELVNVDNMRFRRIMSNILGNAVKFTPRGGRVTISAVSKEVSKSGYARYEFKIADNGIGMSEEFLTRIFKAFEREDTSTRTGYPGTGLGLSITKNLLDIMGGSISVESKKGEGSTFTVSLPLKLANLQQPEAAGDRPVFNAPAASEHGTGHRILLVEDIEINRILAETVLKKYGYTVESVPDGCDAVEAVKNHDEWYYDLVLMDIQMPVMNGYEATRAIRALGREDAEKMPIIALSANASIADKKMSVESGMDTHIAKPFEIDDLINTVREYIQKGQING